MILLGTNESILKHSFKEINKITAVAGPKLNMDKTEILVTGDYQNFALFCEKSYKISKLLRNRSWPWRRILQKN